MADPLIGMTIHFDPPAPSRDQDQAPRGGNGSQVLPVAELDDDFAGDPEDGSQYLYLVRREAASHARIHRVDNPYEVAEAAVQRAHTATPASRPSEAWRETFVRNFDAARKRMLLAPIHSLPPVDPANIPPARDESAWRVFINGKRTKAVKVAAPPAAKPVQAVAKGTSSIEDTEMTDLEAAKAAILASLDLDSPDAEPEPPAPAPVPAAPPTPSQQPEYERLPQLPSPALLVAIPPPALIHLLSHFNEWYMERIDAYEDKINYVPSTIFAPPALRRKAGGATKPAPAPPPPSARTTAAPAPAPPLPSAHESHWLLSILTRLEQVLDGDDLSTLRLLGKTLAGMAEASEAARAKRVAPAGGRSMQERREDEEEAEGRARCWMVVAAIAGVWAQGDLWDSSL
ncbi:SIP1 domain-containing protein [Rhodotorula paludigena]|uniref:SIP1 domain-containing protein n=1 Tax=Rhodotorula paludigena TaxID=86838 RepID=UPI003177677F